MFLYKCDLQVFLEPFSRVLGQAKSKQVLITVAQSDPKHMNCLHRLGILLGITDWTKDYQKKLNPPQSHSYNMHTAPVEQAKVRTMERLYSLNWMSHNSNAKKIKHECALTTQVCESCAILNSGINKDNSRYILTKQGARFKEKL